MRQIPDAKALLLMVVKEYLSTTSTLAPDAIPGLWAAALDPVPLL